MAIREILESDLKQAMKSRESERVSCIRMLKSRLQEKEVELRGKHGSDYRLSEEDELRVVTAYAKQRKDSIESYRRGGRDDLADGEQRELEIVGAYLPAPISEEELRRIVQEGIAESGATSINDMGRVMKLVMPRLPGGTDGKQVNRLVRDQLE